MIEESFLPPCSYCVKVYPPSVAVCSLHKALFCQFHVYKQHIAIKWQANIFSSMEKGKQVVPTTELIQDFEDKNLVTLNSREEFWKSPYKAF